MVAQRTTKRLLLGRELAHLLAESKKNQTQAAELIESRQSKIADLLNGLATISPGDLQMLARGLGAKDEGYLEELMELRRDNHKRGFWTSGHRRAYHEDFRLMVDLETHADLIRAVESEAIPGNAQCESYVRALFQTRDDEDAEHVEDLVQARLARRTILDNEALDYRVVMSESALRRERGGPEVMREQIDHLIKLSKRKNVIVQVIPFSAREAPSIEIRFIMVRVPSPGLMGPLEVAYVEGVSEFRYVDDSTALATHDAKWARLTSAALSPTETRRFMKDVGASF